jgi:hypothetical protein
VSISLVNAVCDRYVANCRKECEPLNSRRLVALLSAEGAANAVREIPKSMIFGAASGDGTSALMNM